VSVRIILLSIKNYFVFEKSYSFLYVRHNGSLSFKHVFSACADLSKDESSCVCASPTEIPVLRVHWRFSLTTGICFLTASENTIFLFHWRIPYSGFTSFIILFLFWGLLRKYSVHGRDPLFCLDLIRFSGSGSGLSPGVMEVLFRAAAHNSFHRSIPFFFQGFDRRTKTTQFIGLYLYLSQLLGRTSKQFIGVSSYTFKPHSGIRTP
jgi:hypothetical protein